MGSVPVDMGSELWSSIRLLCATPHTAEVRSVLLERLELHLAPRSALLIQLHEECGPRVVAATGSGQALARVGASLDGEGLLANSLREVLAAPEGWLQRRWCGDTSDDEASLICVRIGDVEAPWGALALLGDEIGRDPEEPAHACLQRLADFAGIALRNAERYERLVEVSRHDPLTGLVNHGHFWSTLTAEMSRAHRYLRNLSVVMIDVDHFKGYNDTRGHLAGDHALIQVARCIEGRCRASDVAARPGGDEFAVVLPETPLVGALSFGEKIRSGIEALGLCAESGERLTASVGVASFPEDAESGTELVRIADEQLYRAKARGKNCVCGAGYESR